MEAKGKMKNHHRKGKNKPKNRSLFFFGVASLFWFIFRTGTRPSRIVYPCQRAALANSLMLLSSSIFLSLTTALTKTKKFLSSKKGTTLALLILMTSVVISNAQFWKSLQLAGAVDSNQEIQLTLEPRNATVFPASNIHVVNGRTYVPVLVSELINLMGERGLPFYKSDTEGKNQGLGGLIAKNDVVIIKVNSQWDERGGTNTDILKAIIEAITNHPDGFIGEIVVADNGQDQYGSFGGGGSLDWQNNNAENRSQSVQKVVDMFSDSYNVSTYLWDEITLQSVGEYSEGDMKDGYIVNQTANPTTGIKVSYPKFKTKFGTYISFKRGIWNPETDSYDDARLKVINMPVLKSHSSYGVTACVKHFMGVTSDKLTGHNAHQSVGSGGMGTEMVETRMPTLNILDAIWINANPGLGPRTSYSQATRVNVIMASTDPVALDYWAAKHVLMQAAQILGFGNLASIDPDNTASGSFGKWLRLSMQEIQNAGYQATTNEDQMNVYVVNLPPFRIGAPSQNPGPAAVKPYQNVNVTVEVVDEEVGVREVILSYSIDEGQTWTNITMDNISGNIYMGVIQGFEAGTKVQYKIIAYNNADNQAVEDNAGEYYVYTVIPEFQGLISIFIITTLIVAMVLGILVFRYFRRGRKYSNRNELSPQMHFTRFLSYTVRET